PPFRPTRRRIRKRPHRPRPRPRPLRRPRRPRTRLPATTDASRSRTMLAYVFWHWRRAEVDAATYVGRLAAFHEALRRSAPEGFEFSAAFRAGAAPWVPADESYEDWYVAHGSYALDPLNDGAVTGDCKAPHDASARSAAGGRSEERRVGKGGR